MSSMSIGEEIKVGSISQFSTHHQGSCAHSAGSKTRIPDSDFVFSENKPVSRRSTPLNGRKRRAALSQASHGSFCVNIYACGRTATKNSSSTVEIRLCLLALLTLRRRLVTRKGILRLGQIASALSTSIPRSPCRRFVSIVTVSVATALSFAATSVAWSLLRSSSTAFWESARPADMSSFNVCPLRCVTAQIAELPRSERQDGWVVACLNFHHLDNNSGHCGRSWSS